MKIPHSNLVSPPQLTVFFDGLCPLCSREIDHYRSLDRDGSLKFVDITEPGFDAVKEGLDPEKVHKVFHVKTTDAKVLQGVEAFAEIWASLPRYRWAARASRLAGVRTALELGYATFAKLRPYLPRRQRIDCASGYCTDRSKLEA